LVKETIIETVTNLVNKNIHNLRAELIKKTIEETTKAVEECFNIAKKEEKNETVHSGFSCNICNVFPIVGNRYKCTHCFDYDVCQKCDETVGVSHPHPLIKHRASIFKNNNNSSCNKSKEENVFKPLIMEI
jgi:hypothetical protein